MLRAQKCLKGEPEDKNLLEVGKGLLLESLKVFQELDGYLSN